MDVCIKLGCNWVWKSECDLSKSVKTETQTEDIFIKPILEDIISEERAILLEKPQELQDACRLHFEVESHTKIAAVSLVCTTPKLEVYLGPLLEYSETYFGEQIDDEASYIYHMEIQRSGIKQIEVKFITCEDNICIFGMIMQVAPNPNGITTQQQPPLQSNFNMDNVQQMLDSSSFKDNSPKAEKCKLFMEMMSQMAVQQAIATSNTNRSSIKNFKCDENVTEMSVDLVRIEESIKQHIDKRFLELECKINEHFEMMNKNFAKILNNSSHPNVK